MIFPWLRNRANAMQLCWKNRTCIDLVGARQLLWSGVFAVAVVIAINFIPSNKPYVVIDATSEMLTYRVRRPGIAAFPLVDARLRGEFATCAWPTMPLPAETVTGSVEPAAGSVVRYRFTPDRIAIDVDGGNRTAGTITLVNGTSYQLPSRIAAVLATQGKALRPLPVAGPAEIGREFGSGTSAGGLAGKGSDFMYGGSIKVYGFALFPPFSGALYSSGADFALPAGGRLTSGDDFNPLSPQSTAAPWFGIAEPVEKGFRISATTVSSDVRMYRPGATGEVETFALSLLTRIFYDPSLAVVTLFLSTFAFLIQPLKTLLEVKKTVQDQQNTSLNHDAMQNDAE
ncbi:hypothetical protein [Megalodesulfovibrio paquesii]